MIPETHLEAACDLVAEVVRHRGRANLGVTGCSMLPVIRPGDVLTVRRHRSGELKPGQVVLYSRNGRLTAHRVLKLPLGFVLTQGDSLPTVDPPVKVQEVVGHVVSIQRNGRELNPRQSLLQAAAAAVMRRSDWCKRLYLRLSFKLEQFRFIPSTLEY